MTTTQLEEPAITREALAGPGRIEVTNAGGDQYLITVREHVVLVDQPVTDGGDDAASTPVELMVGALASCVAYYAGRYLRRLGLEPDSLRVRADFSMAADGPARVRDVSIAIEAPGLPADRRKALLAVASHCTVHNTLREPPAVAVTLK
jgi:putative redox protein